MSSLEFEVRFEELRAKFLERMAGDQARMRELVAELTQGGPFEVPAKKLRHLAHQYFGNGRSFGFVTVGIAAGALEAVLENSRSDEEFAAARERLPALFNDLNAAFEAALLEKRT